jgi:D-tyrosyl-tRNA(Tyr) deacylase
MRIVLQRVKEAGVEVEGRFVGRIGRGFCLLIGVEKGDSEEEAEALAAKITELRVFPDSAGKMNLSLCEIGGEVLAVSQFTLAGSTKKGRRPSFDGAEESERAEALINHLAQSIRQRGFRVETGVFQENMDVHLINEGPVTFVLEARKPALSR